MTFPLGEPTLRGKYNDGAPKLSDEKTLEEVVNETIVMLKTEGRMPWRAKIVDMQTTESQVTVTMSLGPQLTIDINSSKY